MSRLEPDERPPPERRSSRAGTPVETSGTGEENEEGLTPAGSGAFEFEDDVLTRRLKDDITTSCCIGYQFVAVRGGVGRTEVLHRVKAREQEVQEASCTLQDQISQVEGIKMNVYYISKRCSGLLHREELFREDLVCRSTAMHCQDVRTIIISFFRCGVSRRWQLLTM